jgi:hypothetical protein
LGQVADRKVVHAEKPQVIMYCRRRDSVQEY